MRVEELSLRWTCGRHLKHLPQALNAETTPHVPEHTDGSHVFLRRRFLKCLPHVPLPQTAPTCLPHRRQQRNGLNTSPNTKTASTRPPTHRRPQHVFQTDPKHANGFHTCTCLGTCLRHTVAVSVLVACGRPFFFLGSLVLGDIRKWCAVLWRLCWSRGGRLVVARGRQHLARC